MKNIFKDYHGWMKVKANIHNSGGIRKINEGDVVWAAVGENVGTEIDGKGNKYSRPVIVLRKHTERCFTGVPLTSQPHKGSWYVDFEFQYRIQNAVLIQTRLMDAARVYNRIGRLSRKDYLSVLQAYLKLIKGKNMP